MRHKLDNGLTILLEENHAARVVAFQAWVQVGSGDETDAEAGLAHLHEHMLFKGTQSRGVGIIARDVEAAGGDINASTSHDQTVYHLVMPSRDFEVGAEILADALRRATFDEEELQKEKEVVLEEISRSEDMPGSRLSRHVFDLAYSVHPYRRPILGSAESVERCSRRDVLAFYKKHYRPQRTVLVVAGDFDEMDALGYLRELFEDWSPGLPDGETEEPSPRVPEAEPEGLRVRVLEEDVRECHLAVAWPVPRVGHADIAPLDVLSVILGHGESSRILTSLLRRKHVVNSAGALVYAPRDPGLLMVACQAPRANAPSALSGLLEEIRRLGSEPPGEEELEKAKTIIESDMVYQAQTMQGQASRLGFFECVAGAVELEEIFYRQVRSVTAEDVSRVARTYLTLPRQHLVALVPPGSGLDEGEARRICEQASPATVSEAPPAPRHGGGEIEVLHKKLSSGMTLLVQPDPAVSLVSMRAVAVGGQRYETEANAGINTLASRLLTAGTESRDAEEIARLVDGWAGSLSGESGHNSFGMEAEFLARYFEQGLRLMAECITRSAFPQHELDKERALLLEELNSKEDYPSELVFDLFRRTLWQRHPYRMELRGSRESLEGLDAESVRSYVAAHYQPSEMHLAVVGGVEPEQVVDLAEELFGAESLPPPDAKTAPPRVESEPPLDEPRRAEIQLEREQAHLVIGYPGVRLSDPDRSTLEVLSTILSGQGGRLFVELRDRRSLAYSVGSFSQEGIDPGFFGIYMGCSEKKIDEAISAIGDELSKLRKTPVSDEELTRAKRYLVGSHEIGLQRPGSRAAVLAFDDAYGLGYLDHRGYAERIESVTAAMIRDAAGRYLHPKREVLAIIRPLRK